MCMMDLEARNMQSKSRPSSIFLSLVKNLSINKTVFRKSSQTLFSNT